MTATHELTATSNGALAPAVPAPAHVAADPAARQPVSIQHTLSREAEAARSLLLNMRDVLGSDEQAASDMVEGETNLIEAIASATARVQELEAYGAALSSHIKELGERKGRFENQAEMIRAAILSAMATAELRKVELPIATLSRRPVAPSVTVVQEADIPSSFWLVQPPKLDKKALLAALKDKQTIPGAQLSNGGETLSIRGA